MSEGSTGSTRNKTRSNPVRHMKNSVKPGKSDCGSSALMCVCRRGPSPRRRLLSFVQFGNRIRLDFAAPATMAAIESLPTIYNPKQLDHHFTARSLSVSSAHRIPVVFIFFFLGFFFLFHFWFPFVWYPQQRPGGRNQRKLGKKTSKHRDWNHDRHRTIGRWVYDSPDGVFMALDPLAFIFFIF